MFAEHMLLNFSESGHPVFQLFEAKRGLHWLFGQEFLQAQRMDRQSERVGVTVFFFFIEFMFS